MSYMFYDCNPLIEISIIESNDVHSKNNIIINSTPNNENYNFEKSHQLSYLFKTNMSYIFFGCKALISLPDVLNWNTSKVKNMMNIFCGCNSLDSLPDISKWNASKANNISGMFCGCRSLTSIPDISKWDITNVKDTSYLFYECISLKSIPDI